MSECTHNCATCKAGCPSGKQPVKAPMNAGSHVTHIIGVASGKGGVGKSMLTCLLACAFAKAGYRTGILDADITGPSVPYAFGLSGLKIEGDEYGMIPAESNGGIKMISVNLLLEDAAKPVVFRGAAVSATVKQFWSEVHWGELDYLFVDMPPGTGDVPLTVYQNLPLSGVLLVGTPQSLVSMIVEKAVNMAKQMNVPVLGLVENMSYVMCPDCGKQIRLYGEDGTQHLADKTGIPLLARLPLDPVLTALVDHGKVEEAPVALLDGVVAAILAQSKNS